MFLAFARIAPGLIEPDIRVGWVGFDAGGLAEAVAREHLVVVDEGDGCVGIGLCSSCCCATDLDVESLDHGVESASKLLVQSRTCVVFGWVLPDAKGYVVALRGVFIEESCVSGDEQPRRSNSFGVVDGPFDDQIETFIKLWPSYDFPGCCKSIVAVLGIA